MDDNSKQQIIDEYETRVNYYNNLKDDVTNIQKSIADMKSNIKNVVSNQERLKTANYNIWSQLENKDSISSKTTEEKEPTITDIIGSFKL